ncbi:alpha/beta fold hydrolase [Paenibacillus donghaensis]|uniref:alpha/beta fold hydrolase n=1 Tax=Paenibacillus donghaensis TaxID=414771 RepID=UPI001FEB0F63|nr:alpha/beta hydrolase [Paenibacillus donghaensis]
MAQDMVELLDFLHIDSVILAGHSMGAQVAGYVAAQFPQYIRGLALLDKSASGPVTRSEMPLQQIPALDPVTQDWPLPFASLSDAQRYIREALDSELSSQYFLSSLTETSAGYQMMFSSQAMAANMAYNVDWYSLLPEIVCPVLLVRAKHNEAVPDKDYYRMQELIPNCIAFEMSHPHHNVYLGNPEEFYSCFDQLLQQVRG